MTDTLLPWSTPTLQDLGPVSVAQLNSGPLSDNAFGSDRGIS